MPLTFKVETYKDQPIGRDLSFTVDTETYTIGRGEDNNFMLPDAERIVSQRHASIYLQGGAYYLADTSTNGTFLNNSSSPIGQGNSVMLNDGDTLSIGYYQCRVTVAPAASAPPPQPEPLPEFQPAPPQPASDLPVGNDIQEPYIDPLALLNGGTSAPIADTPTTSDPLLDPDSGGHIPENVDIITPETPHSPASDYYPSPERELFQPPSAVQEGLIPDDWISRPTATTAPETPSWPQAPVTPIREAMVQPTRPPEPEPESKPEPKPQAPVTTATPRPTTTPADMDAINAFLTGAGLPRKEVPPESAIEFMTHCGQLLREMTRCSKQALDSRRDLRSAFRLTVTTISHVENNAIKQSLDVDDALEKLLFPPARGYLPPIEAAQEAADDILAHQMAILAGLKAALRAMVERFDPQMLEKGFQNRSVLDNLLPMAKKAKSWELFKDVYAQIASDAENDFMHLLGEEFAIAYEQQIAKLKSARRQNNELT